MQTAGPLAIQPCPFEVQADIEKAKMYTLLGTQQIPTELIQAGSKSIMF
jgi:hypothetical protein